MYGLIVEFDLTRTTPLYGGCNYVLNFRNVVADSKNTGDGYHGGSGGIGRKLEFWHCVWENLKRNCPNPDEDEKNNIKYDGGANNKRAKVKGGELHTMFTSLVYMQSWVDFSGLGEDNEFTLHKFHIKGGGAQDFEGHVPMEMYHSHGTSSTHS